MRRFLFCILILTLSSLSAEEPALDSLINSETLWETKRADFVTENKQLGFHWVSTAEDAAQTTQKGLTLFQIPIYQAIMRFESDKLKEITVLFYNRGDAGDVTKEAFELLLKRTSEAVSNFTKTKFVPRGKDAKNAVKADGLIWKTEKSLFLLEYSFTKEVKTRDIPYRAEFIRMEIAPNEKPKDPVTIALAARNNTRFSGVVHVKKDPSGDVVIEGIPMVDQGQKGYCVVASAERVMRYYGTNVDSHELAQVANTKSEGGTTVEAMVEALKKLGSRLRIKIRTLEQFGVKEVLAIVEEYNRATKRGKLAPEVKLSGHLDDVYTQMKSDLLRESRTKNKSDLNRFLRSIQSHINQGIPLLWTVMLGVMPEEKGTQGMGGHMRLIIGANEKTREVLFSDSWGTGHELKRMPLADAWAITQGLHTIEPL